MSLIQGCPDLVTSEANFMKNLENSMKTQFVHFNFPLKFSWNLWNIVSIMSLISPNQGN